MLFQTHLRNEAITCVRSLTPLHLKHLVAQTMDEQDDANLCVYVTQLARFLRDNISNIISEMVMSNFNPDSAFPMDRSDRQFMLAVVCALMDKMDENEEEESDLLQQMYTYYLDAGQNMERSDDSDLVVTA